MTPKTPLYRLGWTLSGLTVFSACASAGEFYQLDTGPAGVSVVAVKSFDALKVTASHARWSKDGRATSWSVVQNLPWSPGGLQLAAGVQGIVHRSAPDAPTPGAHGLGLKFSAEWQPRSAAGQAYLLVEQASVFGAWGAVAQFKPEGLPWSLEWARSGDERWYVGRTLALRYALPASRWSIRLGHRASDQQIFVGLSYNSF